MKSKLIKLCSPLEFKAPKILGKDIDKSVRQAVIMSWRTGEAEIPEHFVIHDLHFARHYKHERDAHSPMQVGITSELPYQRYRIRAGGNILTPRYWIKSNKKYSKVILETGEWPFKLDYDEFPVGYPDDYVRKSFDVMKRMLEKVINNPPNGDQLLAGDGGAEISFVTEYFKNN